MVSNSTSNHPGLSPEALTNVRSGSPRGGLLRSSLVAALTALGSVALLSPVRAPAQAQTYTVTTTSDVGTDDGSLRKAVLDSNANDPAPDARNVVNANGAQTITSPTGAIDITRSVEIGTGGDALRYGMTGGLRGLVIPAGTSGVDLVLGGNFTLVGSGLTNFQAVSIGSAGNRIDVRGTLDASASSIGSGVVANGGNNVINVSGTIKVGIAGGAAIRALGDENTINVSGTLSNSAGGLNSGVLWATGNRNLIDVSGTITGFGISNHSAINLQGNDNQLDVSGSVTENNSSGTIAGIGVAGDNNTINVSGTVAATGTFATRRGINVVSGTNNAITVQAGGTVSSAGGNTIVFNGAGTSNLTNHGTIIGGVTMSNGVSTLSVATGSSISGAVNGGSSGNNTLRLIGSGADTYAGTFTNFQKLDADATGGTWSLLNNQTYLNGVNVVAGTLQLGDGTTVGSIVGNIANNSALVFNNPTATTYADIISGTGTVSQIGAGTTTLTGVNTYTGGTTITAGTLTGSATSFGSGNILNNATLIINQPANATFANVISGSGSFTKQGAGVLALTGANTHAGGTTITTGTLQLGDGGAIGSIVGNVANDATLVFNRSDAGLILSGAISGAGAVNQTGSGTTTLAGTSTYTGSTTVAGGELRLAAGGQMLDTAFTIVAGHDATLTVTGSGTLWSTDDLSLGSLVADPATLSITDGARLEVTAASQIDVGSHATATVNISGPGSTWDVPTSVILNNNGSSNNIQGIVNVIDGGLVASNGLTIGSPFGGGNLDAIVLVSGTGSTWTIQNGFSINKGAMSVLDGGRVTAASGTMGGTAAHPGRLLVSGTDSRLKSTGTFNIGNRYSTATLAEGGRLTAGGAVTLTGTLNIGGAAGAAATTAGVLDAVTLAFGGSTGALNFNHTDTAYAFAPVISGAGTINQTGPGTTNLTGNSNAFTGTTNVNAGKLLVNGTLGNATSTLTVLNGGTLGGAGTIGGAVTVANGGHLAPGNSPGTLTMGPLTLNSGSFLDFELGATNVVGGALNDLINVNGALTLDGTLTVTVPAGGLYDPGIYRLINYTGALTDNGLDLGALPAGSTASNTFVQTAIANQVNLINTAGLTFRFWDGPMGHANGIFDGSDGLWLASGDSNWTVPNPTLNDAWTDAAFAVFQGTAGTVVVDDSAGAVNFAGAQFLVDGYTINGPGALNTETANTVIRVGDGTGAGAAMTATINATVTGSGGLVKSDAGTLVLGGDNTYTGGTTISAGTLQLGAGGTTGSIAAGDIANNGTLAFNRADGVSFDGVISGSGSVAQIGGGTTTLGGVNTYSGGTAITAGTPTTPRSLSIVPTQARFSRA